MNIEELWSSAPVRPLTEGDRVVVLSDWHMGDGGPNDDFKKNAAVVLEALTGYYEPRGWTLLLNGDIEEWLRARPEAIRRAWGPVFDTLERFEKAGRLVRLVGNHELLPGQETLPFPEALRFDYGGRPLFIFHGHQAGKVNSGKFNRWIGWSLRVFANTLRIGNPSIAHDNDKKIKLEKAVYEFSRARGAITFIGHTHRPLFESLSRKEASTYHLERLCRRYARASGPKREVIRQALERYRNRGAMAPGELHLTDVVYDSLVVPCLFNSGCAVGKRGFTALEIKAGKLALTFWSDQHRSQRWKGEYKPTTVLPQAQRFILRREKLDYLFSRIELLKEF